MRFHAISVASLAAALSMAGFAAQRTDLIHVSGTLEGKTAPAASKPTPPTPVLVELFTSEGCSSCPPADSLLSWLDRTQPVPGADAIVLEEHVDYWDRLGWKDPFSSAAISARQGEYSEVFEGAQVYTPQMIVDGRTQFVGSVWREAQRAIRDASQAPKPAVHLEWAEDGMISIRIDPLAGASNGDQLDLFLAVTENKLHSHVERGENAGRALEHDGVVRRLVPLGAIEDATKVDLHRAAAPTEPSWTRANLRAVVFVQEHLSRRVLAIASLPFPSA